MVTGVSGTRSRPKTTTERKKDLSFITFRGEVGFYQWVASRKR